ncbi:receptor-interacting serine/threonine-protein kinase 3-like isoform 2-T2 [Polymixia lowei]
MATPSSPDVKIDDEVLQNWETIGSGGFGQVYRARHKKWGFDVAIKILFSSSPSMCQSLLREAEYMTKASKANSFVLNVFGLYEGCPPDSGDCKRLGMVIEFMERGSLLSFHQFLSGPLPFPLGFRLAHQVALGLNFLHNLESPLLHQDLKPNNVLLDDNLNAKLADFGLSRESYSVIKSSKSDDGDLGGTLAFTPPEGFSLSYRPVRSYDIYSFGILLWCILTGKEPYPGNHAPVMFELRINKGDRPVLTEIDQSKADGLGELVDLMQKCWDHEPSKRPPFQECLKVTEPVFLRHKKETYGCVKQVLSDLDSGNNCQPSPAPVPTSSNVQPTAKSVDTVDHGNLTKHENPTHKQNLWIFIDQH